MCLKFAKFRRFGILTFLCVLAACALGQGQFVPPLGGLKNYGCDAQGYETGAWTVHVWADYADGRKQGAAEHGWIALYAVRTGKQAAKKAIADCGEWVSETKQRIERAGRKPKQK